MQLNIISLMGYVVIGTMVVMVATYFLHQKLRAGKIRVFVYSKDRYLRPYFLRQAPNGTIKIGEHTYNYNEEATIYTRSGLLKQSAPTLFLVEGKVDAVHPFDPRAIKSQFSSEQLTGLLEDKTIVDLERAGSGFGLQQLGTYVVVGAIVMAAAMAGGFYYTIQQVSAGG